MSDKSKKNIEILTTLPGVGAKSAKALYEAGFKTKEAVISADEKDLLAVSGVCLLYTSDAADDS